MTNSTQSTSSFNYTDCLTIKEVGSFVEFFKCIDYLAQFQSLFTTIYSICLISGSFILNLTLIFLLSIKTEITVFDKILQLHAVIDFLLCFIDYPFMVSATYFGYWPFSEGLCMFWVIADNSLSILEIYSFLIMSWVRIRCIIAPRSYLNDILVKHTYKCTVCIWIVIFIIWTSVSIPMMQTNFTQSYCYINFELESISISVILIGYMLPLCLIVIATVFINVMIYKKKAAIRQKYSNESSFSKPISVTGAPKPKERSWKEFFRISPQLKLTIIITIFLFQYIPYYTDWFISVLCPDCVPLSVSNFFFYFSYSPSIINPLVVFILNRSLFKRSYVFKH